MARHLGCALVFVALAVAWTLPLALHLSTHLPGSAVGDNVVFQWNFWWMRTALASGVSFFHATSVLVPFGADLTLHTHTALPALAGATLLARLPLDAALNVTTMAALSLNGFCAYLLAWRTTHDRMSAIVAGIIFGCSPYIAAHLNGHFNSIAAWPLPLFALVFLQAMRARPAWWGGLAGVLLATTAYIDSYFVVYEGAFALCVVAMAAWTWSLQFRPDAPSRRWVRFGVYALLILDAVLLAILHGFNLLQAFWVLAAIAAWLHLRPRIAVRYEPAGATRALRATTMMAAVFLAGASPLVWNAMQLIARGDYASQPYFWRSAPVGIDVATLVLGNPFHSVWGDGVRHVYGQLRVDPIESVAWLGVVPLALSIHAIRRRSNDADVRLWTTLGCVFVVWSLGTHVHAFGRNTGLITPSAALHLIPIVANARMPGRAMVMVYLAMAMLAAVGLRECRGAWRSTTLIAAIPVLVLADFFIAPFPIVQVGCPPIYETLRDRPETGAVAELPLGLGDGFAAVTPVDNRMMLACQTVHGRPLVGGFIARLSPRVLAAYRADPLLATWLRLSGAPDAATAAPPGARLSAERLRADGIGFIVLDRSTASPALVDHVEHDLPLTRAADDGSRTLFVVAR